MEIHYKREHTADSGKKRRILLVSPLPPAMGGISVSTDRLRTNLEKDGWYVDTYNLQKPVGYLPHNLWMLLNTLWMPFYVLFHRHYDVVHLHVSSYWRRVYVWMTRPLMKRAKVVVTIHGDAREYTRRPLAGLILRSAHAIICVRPGDRLYMPASVFDRTVEIPAFIMPADVDSLKLPADVASFIGQCRESAVPLVVFNGMAVTDAKYPDLYGIRQMADAVRRAKETGRKFGAMLIVNDLSFNAGQQQIVDYARSQLEGLGNVALYTFRQFSLLPVFKQPDVIYVRPTLTDGDSLSVREALALGARVVASDVAPRPEGTLTFTLDKSGEALYDALTKAIDTMAESADDARRAGGDRGFYPQVVDVYERLLADRHKAVSPRPHADTDELPRPDKVHKLLWTLEMVWRCAVMYLKLCTTLRTSAKAKAYQLSRLQRLVRHAWDNVPFYRELWQKAGFEPSMLQSLDDMRLIPVVNKQMLRAQPREALLAKDADLRRMDKMTTGGTTGMAFEFYIDNYKARAKEEAHQLYAAWRKWHIRQGVNKCVTLRGDRIDDSDVERGIYWRRSKRDRGLVFSSYHLTEETYPVYMAKIRKYRPKYLRCYPSSLLALCQLIIRHGDAPVEGLRAVVCSSENVFEWQRNLVRQALGVEICDSYGHTEKSTMAFWCDGQMCFPPRYGYTEFVDEEMRPLDTPGGKGQIVATGFDVDSFPFIRYNTEDFAVIGTPVEGYPQTARQILGRAQDFLIDRKGNRIPFTCSDEVFWTIKGLDAYQYYQDTPGLVVIRVLPNGAYNETEAETILREARNMFRDFDITLCEVDDIPRTRTGKFRYLIQNIPMDSTVLNKGGQTSGKTKI